MNYTLLIKLLYLADRKALQRWGESITTDRFVSMDNGPVLSHVYNHIKRDEGEAALGEYWAAYVSPHEKFEVRLLGPGPGHSELSQREIAVLEEVYSADGQRDVWDLIKRLHRELPEWHDPKGSSVDIDEEDILRAVGWTEEAIRDRAEDQRAYRVEATILRETLRTAPADERSPAENKAIAV